MKVTTEEMMRDGLLTCKRLLDDLVTKGPNPEWELRQIRGDVAEILRNSLVDDDD
jgi:hypothetical protein